LSARLALAVAWGATAAPLVYALLRAGQALSPSAASVDPALVSFAAHAGFFARAWTAAFASGAVAFTAWVLVGRNEARAARALAVAVPLAAAAAVAQALLLP
jgi:hypothetical protein